MICNRCHRDKEKIEFQTDNSVYCNSCIKQFGQPNLMETTNKMSELKPKTKPNPQDKDINKAVI